MQASNDNTMKLWGFLMAGWLLLATSSAFAEERNDMLDAASIPNGHTLSMVCATCHTFDKGGPVESGPNLFGIMGANHAREPKFPYSQALKQMKKKIWTVDAMDAWLKQPNAYAPGTSMRFGGLLDPQDRADLIAYLRTLNDPLKK